MRWKKLLLATGFLSLAAAAGFAHVSPAMQYELSLYAETPLPVWVFLAGAYAVSLVFVASGTRRMRALALTLGTAATMLLVGLFLVRDYQYLGAGDALTHLGWAKSMAAGGLDPVELLYPATHLLGIVLTDVTGGSLERNMLLVTLLFALAYIVGTAVLVRRLTDNRWGTAMGVVSAWLFLPILNVSSYMMPFPTTQAIFFAPFVLFALVFFFQRGLIRPGGEGMTASGVLLVLLGGAMILIHPQQSVNIILVMAAIVGVQTVYRRSDPTHAIATHQYTLVPTAILFGLLLLWLPVHPRSQSAATGVVDGVFNVFGGGPDAAGTIAQRGGSLAELGSGLPVVVLKILGVSLVFLVLSGLAVMTFWVRRDDSRELGSVVLYLTAGGVPIAALFLFYFLSTPTIAFRQLAFAMVVLTVLGAVQLSHIFDSLRERFPERTVTTVAVMVLSILLVFSLVTVFPSPYIFKPNGHVSTQQVEGHHSAFEYGAEGYDYAGIRAGPGRYAHGIYGIDDPVELSTPYTGTSIPEPTFAAANYTETYAEPQYLVVARSDYQREVRLYEGFRYPEAGFERLSRTPGVDKVLANGGMDLYAVNESG
jgi:hypothetical protein